MKKTPREKEMNVPGKPGSRVPYPNPEKAKKPGRGSGGSELSDIEGGGDECNQKGCSH